ncbi:hypothetical protein [Chryseobacterium koreense]
MKIGLVVPGNLWFSPYVCIYTDILNERNIEYDIISWNRDGSDKNVDTAFNLNIHTLKRYQKIIPFLKYLSFIKSTIERNKYEKLIIFGSQTALLLYPFLKKKYGKKFVLDFRDLSIEQLPILNFLFEKVIKISSLNVISSVGFKKYLPETDYLISHNISASSFNDRKSQTETSNVHSDLINVLTIGSIRDYESNLEVVKALANKEDIQLSFVGKGEASERLRKYTVENKIHNVCFHGFYKKDDEALYIKNTTFLNIYYPQIKSHTSALSNRFYNGLIYNKPMIVTSNSVQGNFVEQYNLGVSVNNCDNLDEKLRKFRSEFHETKFNSSAEKLLEDFMVDYVNFKEEILKFLLTK